MLIFVDEAVEDGCAADGVVGEVRGGWWVGLDVGWALSDLHAVGREYGVEAPGTPGPQDEGHRARV